LTNLTDSLACMRKFLVFDRDNALAGGSGDLTLWLLIAGYGLLAFAIRGAARGAPVADVVARMNLQPASRGVVWGGAVGLLVIALLLAPGAQVQPFIYFQF